ncbi:MAG: translation initiation factor [Bacteroidales bacterium]|nr:translation initiation factor [Bacteroidales bacterium]
MSARKKRYGDGIVYSTNPDYIYNDNVEQEPDTLPARQQDLRISLDKKQRSGKKVTLVTGFTGRTEDLKALGNMLKIKCSTGGTVKNGEILIQGDFREKIMQILQDNEYKVKKSGS